VLGSARGLRGVDAEKIAYRLSRASSSAAVGATYRPWSSGMSRPGPSSVSRRERGYGGHLPERGSAGAVRGTGGRIVGRNSDCQSQRGAQLGAADRSRSTPASRAFLVGVVGNRTGAREDAPHVAGAPIQFLQSPRRFVAAEEVGGEVGAHTPIPPLDEAPRFVVGAGSETPPGSGLHGG
jgi:hypothetical protein